MASTATEKRKFTYEDYLKTPDDERYELTGGELLITPSPVPRHQRISGKIEFELRKFVAESICSKGNKGVFLGLNPFPL